MAIGELNKCSANEGTSDGGKGRQSPKKWSCLASDGALVPTGCFSISVRKLHNIPRLPPYQTQGREHLQDQPAAWAVVPPPAPQTGGVWTGLLVAHARFPVCWVGEVETHRQAAHETLLKGPLEGSRVSTPIQQLCSSIVEVGGVL